MVFIQVKVCSEVLCVTSFDVQQETNPFFISNCELTPDPFFRAPPQRLPSLVYERALSLISEMAEHDGNRVFFFSFFFPLLDSQLMSNLCRDVSQSWTMPSSWTLPVRLHPTVSDYSQTQMFCSKVFSVSCTLSEIGAAINVMYDLQSCSGCLRNAGLLSSLPLLCFFFPSVPFPSLRVLTHFAVCLILKEQQSNYPQFSSFCLEIKCGSGRNITPLCRINDIMSGILLLFFLLLALSQRQADQISFP